MAENLELQYILEVIPPDTREGVKAAADKHSKVIHEALYHLTRLEIRDSESSFGKRGTLDVLLEDGHATSKILGKINDLGGVQGQLASLKPAAQKLSEAIQHFQRRAGSVPKVMETFPALVPKPGLLEECLGYTSAIMQQEVTGEA